LSAQKQAIAQQKAAEQAALEVNQKEAGDAEEVLNKEPESSSAQAEETSVNASEVIDD
jgi:hypothetical protein